MKDVNILTSNGVNVAQSLELFGDMEMYDETLKDFLDMVDGKLQSLENRKSMSDMVNYAIEVHALKSDARYLGFTTLADLSYESEMKSKAGDIMFVQENHPKIMAEAKRVIDVAKQYMGIIPVQPVQAQPTQEVAQPAPMAQPEMQAATMVQPEAQVAQPAPVQPMAPVQEQPMQAPVAQPIPVQPAPMVQPETQVAMAQPMPQPQVAPAPVAQEPQVQFFPADQPAGNQQVQFFPQQDPMAQAINVQAAAQPVQQPMMQPQTATQQVQFFPADQPAVGPQVQFFPQQNPMAAQPAPMVQPAVPGQKEGTILIVDDSSLVANFVKKIFDSRYNVLTAEDGAKAIELLDQEDIRKEIKACLLDLNMPNVDGYAVLEHCKQNGYFVRMPVAVESGVEDMASLDRVNAYPIVDVLSKPFNERDVQRVIEKCLATYF